MIGKTISHYRILEKSGEGGMGVVYKAQDTKLDRMVALKFLPIHLLRDEEARTRFVHEAKAASALNHSNITTIHDIDQVEDQCFICMEYIEGKSIKDLMKEKTLSVKEILEIAIQVGEGLNAAHRKDIVHRDIKSDNIMLTREGTVKIMDFGLAKLKGATQLTKPGSTLGTVTYMSPEQTKGKGVDQRTDIWSLGVVLYEMLTGQLPFKGDYEQAVIYCILNENPEPLTSFRTDIPTNLEQVVDKALEKDQTRRYQNIQEILQDLKTSPASTLTSPQQEESIVVLPFDDISPGKDNEYFSDGLTEEIITDLSKIHTLRVISRTSAMRLKGTEKDINRIGKELNVRYVLEGSVRKAGNNLRITAQLIDATTDSHIWAEKYRGTLEDVFDIQEKVSRSIVDALKLKLSSEEDRRMGQRPINNVHAYECYLRARQEIWRFTEDGLERALQYLQNGLDIVGQNALLYAGMGYVYWQYVNMGIKQEDYVQKAEECAGKVFELEPESPQGHLLLGLIQMVSHGNMQQSVRHLKEVLTVNTNDLDALLWLSVLYGIIGKPVSASPLINRALEIDPLNSSSHIIKSMQHYYEGRFDLAIESALKGHQMEPENPGSIWCCALMLASQHRVEDAISFIDNNVDTTSKHFFLRVSIFLKKALLGENDVSELLTDEFITTAKRDFQYSSVFADIYALLGHKKEALDWLENAVNRGFINYPFLSEYDPFLENVRGEDRFKKLMERVKHEWENFEV
jgi:serine/threonine protein kinase/tetratricopeptide (TPR) repeat protein